LKNINDKAVLTEVSMSRNLRAKSRKEFRKELEHLINRYGQENWSDTPDFLLADYLMKCLEAFEFTSNNRKKWFGCTKTIGRGHAK